MGECVSVSKMKIFAAILFTFSVQFTSLISAQEFSFGRCGPFPTVKQFDPQRYSGRWFEYSNYFAFFQLFGKCVTANYRVLPSNPLYGNNVEIEVINKAINSITGAPIEAKGSAILNDPFDPLVPGELIVNFEDQPSFSRSTSTNYNVIDTDYDNFTIIYSCNNYGFLKSELLWILTRQRFPGKLLINHLMQNPEIGFKHFTIEKNRSENVWS